MQFVKWLQDRDWWIETRLRVFATQYKKPKQARHLRDYVELKHNSDALVRKQQGQSFVGEVYWIDSDSGNDQNWYLKDMEIWHSWPTLEMNHQALHRYAFLLAIHFV